MAKQALKRADGTEVSAQEAYDAFMNTRVLIVNNNTTYEALIMEWYDNNSSQTDSANVGYVKLYCLDNSAVTLSTFRIIVGDSSLVPGQQG